MGFCIIQIIQIIGAIVGFFTIIVVAKQKASYNQKILLLACCCAFGSILTSVLELSTNSLEGILVAVKFGYIGKCYALTLFLAFMVSYCGIKMPQWVIKFLLYFNTIILIQIGRAHV